MRSLIIAAALALSACGIGATSPPDTAGGTVATVVDQAMVQATRRLVNANDAYTVVAVAATAAARNGLIPASKAGELRELNRDINTWLDRGYLAATAADRLHAATQVEGLTARLRALTGGSS